MIIRAVRIALGKADAVILAFSDTAGSRRLWADFGPALDLTSAETTLLKRLVDGATVTEAAHDLGVTLETAPGLIARGASMIAVIHALFAADSALEVEDRARAFAALFV